MPMIKVAKPLNQKIKAIKPLVEAVLEEEIDFNSLVELILTQGMENMINSIIGSLDAETFLKSFQQLSDRNPNTVYGYIADMMRSGAAIIEKEKLQEARRKIGFRKP